MKIGTLINIETRDSHTEEVEKYRCKVIEKKNHYIIIDYPINVKDNKTSFLPVGTNITVTYMGRDQAVYQFESNIASKVKSNIPGLAIPYPDKKEIKRIQRREFVRIETSVDVAIHSLEHSFPAFATVTTDISGGGLSILLKHEKMVAVGDKIKTVIVLPIEAHRFHYMIANGEIVFLKSLKNNVKTASLKFTDIDSQDQQMIMRYCFEKQREARQKEIQ
ncbi:flagellar brake protein [Oceanobacillus salinisoli]|uniref:flagellar brake protein n=1 Tax=Oceanobacillus salinisoli TaxID=2678611 RepID=UPI0012E1445F|nr:flagellar brake domain-containing protein [Oceanobacillus salinisoli]